MKSIIGQATNCDYIHFPIAKKQLGQRILVIKFKNKEQTNANNHTNNKPQATTQQTLPTTQRPSPPLPNGNAVSDRQPNSSKPTSNMQNNWQTGGKGTTGNQGQFGGGHFKGKI